MDPNQPTNNQSLVPPMPTTIDNVAPTGQLTTPQAPGVPQADSLPQPTTSAPQPVMQQPQPAPATSPYGAPPQAPVGQPIVQPATVNQEQAKEVAPAGNPNSTQNSLIIAEIRDGIVIMNDGSYRAVAMAKSINFDLMSQQEREAIESSYQGFLNSLYFDIQIFIRSRRVDIRPYMERLTRLRNEQDNMLLALLMEDYIQYITDLSQETNIMNKQFYIVVPFYPPGLSENALRNSKSKATKIFGRKQHVVTVNEADLVKAKDELKNRLQATVNGLAQMNLQAVPLDTQELIELYYDAYNPDTATTQHLQDQQSLEALVVTKGTGQAAQPYLDREAM